MRITDPVVFICAVSNFYSLAEQPGTEQRLASFWALDSTVRTFKPKAKDLAETSSTSLTMSRFVRIQNIQEKNLAEAEEKLADLRTIAAAKEKKIAQLEKEKASLDEQRVITEVGIHEAHVNATEDAKVCAAHTVLQARIKMAEEAMDPSFGRSAWS
ncbi:hypothetical protein Hanom_Chr17g01578881 [Helianthus anomalus]